MEPFQTSIFLRTGQIAIVGMTSGVGTVDIVSLRLVKASYESVKSLAILSTAVTPKIVRTGDIKLAVGVPDGFDVIFVPCYLTTYK